MIVASMAQRAVAIGGRDGLPDTVGRPWRYFERRGCVLDCRGPIVISPDSHWGFGVCVLTESHDTGGGPGVIGAIVPRGVRVDAGAWVGSFSLLIGCHIGEGAIVAAGTVVRCQDVAPAVMVAGNPARVVARWGGSGWVYEDQAVSQFCRRLE